MNCNTNPASWTYGLELELSDCERDTPLPGKSTWDRKDNTIVNSNGVANDPRGRTWKFGGEINTEPTNGIDDQVMVVDNIIKSLSPKPTVNYRSNLHVHIRVPGLSDDVQAIKKAMRYVELHGQRAFDLVDPLPEKPEKGTPEMVRWRRRKQSHQNMLTTEQYANVYHSNSTEQIKLAHVISYSVDGTPQWQFVQRCGVNFLSLWKHDTIEFRHFCGTLSLFEMYFSLLWCRQFLIAALQDHKMTPDSIYGSWGSHIEYPKQPLLSRWHEERYRLTSPRYNSDSEILAQIEFYREEGTL